MKRVNKGEKYWYVFIHCDDIIIDFKIEKGRGEDRARSELGNYFTTIGDALQMARKLRAVLKGADVYTNEELTEIKANAFADGMEAEQRKSKIVK